MENRDDVELVQQAIQMLNEGKPIEEVLRFLRGDSPTEPNMKAVDAFLKYMESDED